MTWKAEPWLVLALETPGVPAAEHYPIEIGFVRVVDGVETAAATYRVRPPIPIPEGASAVHGIRDEDVRDCPTLEDVAPEIVEIIREQRVIVGYNGYAYDFPMLRDRCPGFYAACRGRVFLDPLVLVRTDSVGRFWRNRDRWNPERGRHTLENAAGASADLRRGSFGVGWVGCRTTGARLNGHLSRRSGRKTTPGGRGLRANRPAARSDRNRVGLNGCRRHREATNTEHLQRDDVRRD